MIFTEKEKAIQKFELSSQILHSCHVVMNELGVGFLEAVYKNALVYCLSKKGLNVETEKNIQVYFQSQVIGIYKPDIIVNNCIIIELKCVKSLLPEHQAQVINYLRETRTSTGLLINFANKKLEYKRLYNPNII